MNDEIKQAMRVLAEVCCWPLRHRGFCRFLWFSDVFHWVSVWFLISHTLFWILHFWGRGGVFLLIEYSGWPLFRKQNASTRQSPELSRPNGSVRRL